MSTNSTPTMPTRRTELPLEQRIHIAYFKLAYHCMLPAARALGAGKHDIDALLSVAFSPVMHVLLACMTPTNAWGIALLLERLVRPPDPNTYTQLGTTQEAWVFLNTRRDRNRVVLFDLRPGGGAEFEEYPYVPLYDRQEQISPFSAEALPVVVTILQGWGAKIFVIHPDPTTQLPLTTLRTRAQTQWERLGQQL